MIYYLYIIKSLLSQIWYFPLFALITFAIYSFKKSKLVAPECLDRGAVTINKNPGIILWISAIIYFLILTAPYWILQEYAPHSGPDDATHTLQTYLQAMHSAHVFNWTNALNGGMDRWLLPNCHPLALGRIYAIFLKQPYQLYLWVMGINIISVFVFSWKIQTKFLRISPWMAYIGAAIAVIIEGYWTGIYPNAHVSNGHGFAIIIAGIYWLTCFHEHSKFWLVAILLGIAMALGSWIPFHNLPPLLITVTLWGLVFWGPRAWLKVLQANILIVLTLIIILLPQFLAIKFLYASSSRSGFFHPTVDIKDFYLTPEIFILMALSIAGAFLNIYKEKIVKQMIVMFLGFAAIPLVAYVFEASKLMPAFRWELLYAGNETWMWLAVIFFIDKIHRSIETRWGIPGIALRVLLISVWWTVIAIAWMNSLWFDMDSSYPSGTWKTLTDTSISSALKVINSEPSRVVGLDDTNDMHFWGQYQGLESMIGYTPFIDQRKSYFWWYSAMLSSLHGAYDSGFLGIPIPVKGHHRNINFPVPLPAIINPDALRLTNVRWIVSHHPLYPMPGLQILLDHPGQPMACTQESPLLMSVNLSALRNYWNYMGCLFKDYRYDRPMYVYELTDTLPRAYLARQVMFWPLGEQPILSQDQLALAAKKTAFVPPQEWAMTGDNAGEGVVTFDDYQSDYMRLKISTGQDALLVVATTLNPYWRVLLDDKPAHSFDVNGFQTGVWVHPENQKAELIYCPPWRLQDHPYCSKR